MYAIIREENDSGDWLVVEWKSEINGFPKELTGSRYERQERAVRIAIESGSASVIAYCKRRVHARILAADLRRRERWHQLVVMQATRDVLVAAGTVS